VNPPQPQPLDDVDKAIISELQHDGRISYADLAPRVGLSPAATRQRVQRLLDDGTVQVVGVTDPQRLGYPTTAMLGVNVDGDIRAAADTISAIDGVIYLVLSAGSFDLLVEVIASDPEALFALVNDEVRHVEGVRSVESFLYYSIHTHRFGWPVR